MALTAGTILEQRYRIEERLSRGETDGVHKVDAGHKVDAVYRAHDTLAKKSVILKEYTLGKSPAARQHFEREAARFAQLDHPRLPRHFGHWITPGGQAYLVTEWIEGRDLARLLRARNKPLTQTEAISHILEICPPVEYLHGQHPPLVHGGIQPNNILVTRDGGHVLTGLGLCPANADMAGDIYALGGTLYALLTNETPPERMSLHSGRVKLTQPSQVNATVTPAVEHILLRAMHRQDDRRVQSVAELRQLLSAPDVAPVQPRPHTGWWLGLGAVVIGLLALILFLTSQQFVASIWPELPSAPVTTAAAPASVRQIPTSTPQPVSLPPSMPARAGLELPSVDKDKFNIALIAVGPHDDGGWNQAHYEGLLYLAQTVSNTNVAWLENVPEGAESEAFIRGLARKGFQLILGTSPGYMIQMEMAAADFPEAAFVVVNGWRSNGRNLGSLSNGIETMQYVAGMVAGARAQADGKPQLGYLPTFVTPEQVRLGNVFMLGAKKTCPACTLTVRWLDDWGNARIERDAATALFDAGAQVVLAGNASPVVAEVAQSKAKWAVAFGHPSSCQTERCLTAPYWNWGPVYADLARRVMNKTYTAAVEYVEANSGGVGLAGLMAGQSLTTGVNSLPPETLQSIRDQLAQAQRGQFTRFDIFAGPLKDNTGRVIVPANARLQPADLDQFPPGAKGRECKTCMNWWVEDIKGELPK